MKEIEMTFATDNSSPGFPISEKYGWKRRDTATVIVHSSSAK